MRVLYGFVLAVALIALGIPAQAATVTINFSGTALNLSGFSSTIGGFGEDTTFSGSFSFDDTQPAGPGGFAFYQSLSSSVTFDSGQSVTVDTPRANSIALQDSASTESVALVQNGLAGGLLQFALLLESGTDGALGGTGLSRLTALVQSGDISSFTSRLFRLDFVRNSSSIFGDCGSGCTLSGTINTFALEGAPSAVPLPAPGLLLLAGLLGGVVLKRRTMVGRSCGDVGYHPL